MVGDVPMSPVDARLPPTFTLAATITTSANTVGDEPSEGPVFFCQELARKQVEDVPLPHIDTSIPSTSARAHATPRSCCCTLASRSPWTASICAIMLSRWGLDSLASRHRRTTLKPSRERRITRFRSGRGLLINARHGTALHPSEEGSLPSAPTTSASEPEYMRT